jgi:hypothetical protein
VPSELDGIAAVEAFKELGAVVGTMRPKEENIIDNVQLKAGFLDCRVKEILFKETHEHVSIGGGHSNYNSLYLEVLLGVKEEMVVGKLGKLDKELSGWK